MNWNRSPLAFNDVKEAFDRALANNKGIMVKCSSRAEAISLRARFNYYRKLDRDLNRDVYPEGHALHGNSAYDVLVLRIPARGEENERTLYVEHRSVEDFIIEDIK